MHITVIMLPALLNQLGMLLDLLSLFLSVTRYDIRYEKDDFLLRIKKASVIDQGTFTCLAENRVGKAEASAYLTIRGG